MLPTRRDLHFNLEPRNARNWHARGPYLTHFINAMSLFFPAGERYFIHTVRHYQDQISDPELQKAVTAFIGQEAMHGREHEELNRLLKTAGLPAEEIEAHVENLFRLIKKLPPAAQLSATIAQEHFTAIVAELLLTDPRLIEGADERMAALLRWHALEETEHKSVAFDVYETAVGRDTKAYVLRAAGLLLTTLVFMCMVLYYQQRLLQADEHSRRWQGLGSFAHFMFLRPAFIPRLAGPWLSYLRRDFHPWDHDNSHLLEQMDALVEELQYEDRKAA